MENARYATNDATLSEQFQSPIEKQLMHTVGNVPMSNRETNNATLSEQLHSPI
jgi:hypothetical protein